MEEILLPNERGFRKIQTYPKNSIPIYVKVSICFLPCNTVHCTWVSVSRVVKFPPAEFKINSTLLQNKKCHNDDLTKIRHYFRNNVHQKIETILHTQNTNIFTVCMHACNDFEY